MSIETDSNMVAILLITNKEDITVDYVIRELQRKKVFYYRLNTEDIPEKVHIDFNLNEDIFILRDVVKNITIDLGCITSVYFRRPRLTSLEHIETQLDRYERYYLQREAAQILEGIYKLLEHKYWINNVYRIREAENKIHQLRMAREIGFLIPDTILSNSPDNVKQFLDKHYMECIVKPVRSGAMGDDARKVIFTSRIEESPADLQIQCFPLYLQNCIEKAADLRVITIGRSMYCARIESQQDSMSLTDWRKSKNILIHTEHELPEHVKEKCLEITHKLGLIYSAIDLVLTRDGKYIFLECNPNGQWAWLEERIGFPISEDIVTLLTKRNVLA